MKHCKNCGEENANDSGYYPKCSSPIEDTAARLKNRDLLGSLFTCPAVISAMISALGIVVFIVGGYRGLKPLGRIVAFAFILSPIAAAYCILMLIVLGVLYRQNPTPEMRNNLRRLWFSLIPAALVVILLVGIVIIVRNMEPFS
jgi:hypothetical protein